MARQRSTEPTQDTWDAAWTAVRLAEPSEMGRRIFAEITRHVDVAGQVVLELGCGSAELLCQAAQHGARRVIAVDISPQALANAGGMLRQVDHELIQANMFALPPEPMADVVWSSGLVEHFTSARMLAVMHVHRRLARRHVVVAVPASPHLNDLRMALPRMVQHFGYQRPLSKRRLCALGRAAGMRVRAVRRIMPEYGMGRYYTALPGPARGLLQKTANRTGGLVLAWFDVG